MLGQERLDRLLAAVEKPARYLGGEWNEIVKEEARLRFALCFPDVYEIGMSHLGSRILYHCLNSREEIACERVYAPEKPCESFGCDLFADVLSVAVKGGADDVEITVKYTVTGD